MRKLFFLFTLLYTVKEGLFYGSIASNKKASYLILKYEMASAGNGWGRVDIHNTGNKINVVIITNY